MSININADTTNGLVMTSDTSGELKLQSAGADIVSVTANGIDVTGGFTVDSGTLYVDPANNRVGIGTSSPSVLLHLKGSNFSSAIRWEETGGSNNFYAGPINTTGDFGIDNNSTSGYIRFATNSAERMRIDSSGSLRVGGTSSFSLNEKIALYGTSTANNPTIISDKSAAGVVSSNHILFNNGNGYVGSITTLNSGTGFNTSSDYRLKENNVDITDGITRVKQLNPYRFNFIADADTTVDGFFAHEVQSVVPEAITGTHNEVDDDGNPVYQGIDQSKLVPLLTAALQEAITKIEDLETRIQALENA
jgi:nitrogen regulatory protein PII-like uncharacterized protein